MRAARYAFAAVLWLVVLPIFLLIWIA